MSLNREILFRAPPTRYQAGTHRLPPAIVGAGYQSLAMKATKVDWPMPIPDLFVGQIHLSDDGGSTWQCVATWHDDGREVFDPATGAVLDHSFLRIFFSARLDKPVYTRETTWVRGAFECKKPLTTVITIEGN